MQIVAQYSFNNGKQFLEKHHISELDEVKDVISSVAGSRLKTKISKEKTMKGKAILKRIFYGKLLTLPKEIDEKVGKYRQPLRISCESSNSEYKILYAVAWKHGSTTTSEEVFHNQKDKDQIA